MDSSYATKLGVGVAIIAGFVTFRLSDNRLPEKVFVAASVASLAGSSVYENSRRYIKAVMEDTYDQINIHNSWAKKVNGHADQNESIGSIRQGLFASSASFLSSSGAVNYDYYRYFEKRVFDVTSIIGLAMIGFHNVSLVEKVNESLDVVNQATKAVEVGQIYLDPQSNTFTNKPPELPGKGIKRANH